jgi:hypothetical protein
LLLLKTLSKSKKYVPQNYIVYYNSYYVTNIIIKATIFNIRGR